jgi:hypothetical protein
MIRIVLHNLFFCSSATAATICGCVSLTNSIFASWKEFYSDPAQPYQPRFTGSKPPAAGRALSTAISDLMTFINARQVGGSARVSRQTTQRPRCS